MLELSFLFTLEPLEAQPQEDFPQQRVSNGNVEFFLKAAAELFEGYSLPSPLIKLLYTLLNMDNVLTTQIFALVAD